jgi:hypothetical protein
MFGVRAAFGCIFIAGTFSALGLKYFSPIDEQCHFAYTEHLLKYQKLPNVKDPMPAVVYAMEEKVYPESPRRDHRHRGLASYMYQAVHPPLYYIGSALLSKLFPGDHIQRLYFLRFVGLFALLLLVAMLHRTYHWGIASKVFPSHPFQWSVIIAAFAMNPGILTRMTTVSNLHLALILNGCFYAWILRSEWKSALNGQQDSRVAEWPARNIFLFGILTGLTVLTHPFNITLAGVGLYYLFQKRMGKGIPYFLIGIIIIISPWFISNGLIYGHSTGYPLISSMMQNAVNPTHTLYGFQQIMDQLYPKFFRIFWNPEEAKINFILSNVATQYLSGLLCILLVASITKCYYAWRGLKIYPLSHQIFLLGIGLNFSLLVYLSLAESVPCVLGRYLYLSLWPLVLLSYATLSELTAAFRKILSFTILLSAVMIWVNFFGQTIQQVILK